MVIVRVEVVLSGIEFGLKDLAIESGLVMVRVAEIAASFVAPSVVVIRPAGMVFV